MSLAEEVMQNRTEDTTEKLTAPPVKVEQVEVEPIEQQQETPEEEYNRKEQEQLDAPEPVFEYAEAGPAPEPNYTEFELSNRRTLERSRKNADELHSTPLGGWPKKPEPKPEPQPQEKYELDMVKFGKELTDDADDYFKKNMSVVYLSACTGKEIVDINFEADSKAFFGTSDLNKIYQKVKDNVNHYLNLNDDTKKQISYYVTNMSDDARIFAESMVNCQKTDDVNFARYNEFSKKDQEYIKQYANIINPELQRGLVEEGFMRATGAAKASVKSVWNSITKAFESNSDIAAQRVYQKYGDDWDMNLTDDELKEFGNVGFKINPAMGISLIRSIANAVDKPSIEQIRESYAEIRKDRFKKEFEQATTNKFPEGNLLNQGFYGAVEMAPDLLATGMAGAIAGPAGAGGYSVARFQGDFEESLVYDHGVDPEAAGAIATAVSLPYAIIEQLQVSQILPNVLSVKFIGTFAKKASNKIAKEVTKKAAAKEFAKEFTKDWVNEVAEETIQAVFESGGMLAARELAGGKDIDNEALMANIKENAVGAALSMPFLLGAGRGAEYTLGRFNSNRGKTDYSNLQRVRDNEIQAVKSNQSKEAQAFDDSIAERFPDSKPTDVKLKINGIELSDAASELVREIISITDDYISEDKDGNVKIDQIMIVRHKIIPDKKNELDVLSDDLIELKNNPEENYEKIVKKEEEIENKKDEIVKLEDFEKEFLNNIFRERDVYTSKKEALKQETINLFEEVIDNFENESDHERFIDTEQIEELDAEKVAGWVEKSIPNAILMINKTDNNIDVKLPNGRTATILLKDVIDGENAIKYDGKYISKDNIIELAGDATINTLNHEIFHMAESISLSDSDIATLVKEGYTDYEMRAEAYTEWLSNQSELSPKADTIFQKIKNFFKYIVDSFKAKTSDDVFRKVSQFKGNQNRNIETPSTREMVDKKTEREKQALINFFVSKKIKGEKFDRKDIAEVAAKFKFAEQVDFIELDILKQYQNFTKSIERFYNEDIDNIDFEAFSKDIRKAKNYNEIIARLANDFDKIKNGEVDVANVSNFGKELASEYDRKLKALEDKSKKEFEDFKNREKIKFESTVKAIEEMAKARTDKQVSKVKRQSSMSNKVFEELASVKLGDFFNGVIIEENVNFTNHYLVEDYDVEFDEDGEYDAFDIPFKFDEESYLKEKPFGEISPIYQFKTTSELIEEMRNTITEYMPINSSKIVIDDKVQKTIAESLRLLVNRNIPVGKTRKELAKKLDRIAKSTNDESVLKNTEEILSKVFEIKTGLLAILSIPELKKLLDKTMKERVGAKDLKTISILFDKTNEELELIVNSEGDFKTLSEDDAVKAEIQEQFEKTVANLLLEARQEQENGTEFKEAMYQLNELIVSIGNGYNTIKQAYEEERYKRIGYKKEMISMLPDTEVLSDMSEFLLDGKSTSLTQKLEIAFGNGNKFVQQVAKSSADKRISMMDKVNDIINPKDVDIATLISALSTLDPELEKFRSKDTSQNNPLRNQNEEVRKGKKVDDLTLSNVIQQRLVLLQCIADGKSNGQNASMYRAITGRYATKNEKAEQDKDVPYKERKVEFEKRLTEIDEMLGKKLSPKQLVDLQDLIGRMKEYFNDNFDSINDISAELTGKGLQKLPPETYWPMDNWLSRNIDRPFFFGLKNPTSIFSTRVQHSNGYDDSADFISVFKKKLESTEHVKTYKDSYTMLTPILDSNSLRNEIERTMGKGFLNNFSDQVKMYLNDQAPELFSNKWVKVLDRIFLPLKMTGNINTIFVQLASAFTSFGESGRRKSNLLTEGESGISWSYIFKHPLLQNRLEGGFDLSIKSILDDTEDKSAIKRNFAKVMKAVNVPVRYADMIPVAITIKTFAEGYYQQGLVELNMTEADARDYAIGQAISIAERGQQSTQIKDMSNYLLDKNVVNQAVFRFKTSLHQAYGSIISEIIKAFKRPTSGERNEAIKSLFNRLMWLFVTQMLVDVARKVARQFYTDEQFEVEGVESSIINTAINVVGGQGIGGTFAGYGIDYLATGDKGMNKSLLALEGLDKDILNLIQTMQGDKEIIDFLTSAMPAAKQFDGITKKIKGERIEPSNFKPKEKRFKNFIGKE